MVPNDYEERVYAGILGKIIGVYLGRPFEGWPYERIIDELGEITFYVHEKLDMPLIVTDDDITGTFTFPRALPDYGNSRELTPAQIGQTWLNYIVENKTILWWSGLGNSTEHTAYLRLKGGIEAPHSGSAALNGKVTSEQIGAQIFIDGWAMVAPGDPELAADLARRAASVSHDGEAIYGAQVIAAMEALAFVESDINELIDTAVSLIPENSVIYRMIADIREWHAAEPDWREAFRRLQEHYWKDKYGGIVHMVPNHGLVILSLLYGDDDFQKSLMIVNTCGFDTDCNSGNVGCLLGIKNGLASIDAGPDWRGPVADRLYMPTADGGRAVTDAVTETYHLVRIGRALAGEASIPPKAGARFHFELPGSVQGFQPAEDNVESKGTLTLENVSGHSRSGERSLALHYHQLAPGRVARAATATFIPPEAIDMPGYSLMASPTLFPGQTVRAGLAADADNAQPVTSNLYIRYYGPDDQLVTERGPEVRLPPGAHHEPTWQISSTRGGPIAQIGVELNGERGATGTVYVDFLTWDGAADLALTRPEWGGQMWHRAWVSGVDHFGMHWPEAFRLSQDRGVGLLMQGTRRWNDYRVSADVTPHLGEAVGIAARVQGMRRYYALLLCNDGEVCLVKALDGETVLAKDDFSWEPERAYTLSLEVVGARLQAWIDDQLVFDVRDVDSPLAGGGVAFVVEEGCLSSTAMTVQPARRPRQKHCSTC